MRGSGRRGDNRGAGVESRELPPSLQQGVGFGIHVHLYINIGVGKNKSLPSAPNGMPCSFILIWHV